MFVFAGTVARFSRDENDFFIGGLSGKKTGSERYEG
jgi:hypothetical protein